MGVTGTAAEVAVKLVIDSNAKEATSEVAKGLHHVGDEAKKAGHSVDFSIAGNFDSMKKLAMGAFGFVESAAIAAGAAVVGFAVESAHAFIESEEQVKALAGTLTMLDQNGNSFETLMNYAGDLKDELEDLAVEIGVTDDAMVQMFTDVIERGGKSVEAAKELVEEMAYAGRAFPQGPEALAQGFEALQMGMVRAKNPLVQLIASTGTLKGSAKAVAKEMQGMEIEDQMELAEKAIAKMSAKMKQVPMTLHQMKDSISVMVGNVFEDAGKPIVAALNPIVSKIQQTFAANRDALAGMASGFGENVGRALELIPLTMDELFAAIKANMAEIKAAQKELSEPMKELFEYIYENRHAFAKTIADVTMLIIKAGVEIAKTMKAVYDMIAGALKWIGKSGVLGSGVARSIGDTEMTNQAKDIRSKVMGSSAMGDTGAASLADREAAQQKYVRTYTDTYGDDKVMDAMKQFDDVWKKAVDDHNMAMRVAQENATAARFGDADSFAKAWNMATQKEDQGAQNYVAQFLMNNKALQKALAEDGPKMLGEGFDALIKNLRAQGTIGEDIARTLQSGAKPNLGITPKTNITQNFNGGIHIKQDFRDQDPDRVAIVFREDLMKQGTNLLQSRFAPSHSF